MGLADQVLSLGGGDRRVPCRHPDLRAMGLFLRPASVADLDAYAAALRGDRWNGSPISVVACRLLVDEQGKRVFGDDQADQIAERMLGTVGNDLLEQAIEEGLLGRSPEEARGN